MNLKWYNKLPFFYKQTGVRYYLPVILLLLKSSLHHHWLQLFAPYQLVLYLSLEQHEQPVNIYIAGNDTEQIKDCNVREWTEKFIVCKVHSL